MTRTEYESSRMAETPTATVPPQPYVYGRYHARILPDGTIGYYREVLTPDGAELIGREYPNEDYCWFNLTRAARRAGTSHEEIWRAEEAARDLIFNDAFIEAHRAELGGLA